MAIWWKLCWFFAFFLVSGTAADEAPAHPPQLLLSVKLLRRLKRDQQRQTVRWVNFENRLKSAADSPERGFELALYYAVSGDAQRGKEAVDWAAAHPCERRQRALISDWVSALPSVPCSDRASLRDQALERIAGGQDVRAIAEQARAQLIPQFAAASPNPQELYSLVELLSVLRAASGNDIRNADSSFFRNLPTEFLLSMKPGEVEKPTWISHVAALALVTLDPNLEASQFLQSWAMEDRQTLQNGPGVAYELLWADPYLPGIAYQNLDPWIYDDAEGRLFARSDWTVGACWIAISRTAIQEVNCPKGWRNTTTEFGSMALIPAPPKCIDIIRHDAKENVVLWNLTPGQTITYGQKREMSAMADKGGMWHPGANVEGKVCRH